MAQKRDLWYSRLAMATSDLARVIPNLAIAFHMANYTNMPNFSLLGHPHGPEEGPVLLQAGHGHLQPGEGHP